MDQTKRSSFKRVARLMLINFFDHNVGQNAAALAYYLLFAIFPLLIFISSLLGILDLNVYSITQALSQILPGDVVMIVESYLDYISHTSNHVILWFSLVFVIWFPMRAVQSLMTAVRRAYGLGNPNNIALYTAKQLLYTLVFLVVIFLTLLLSVMGKNVLEFINDLLAQTRYQFSEYPLKAWQYLRFVPIGVLMLIAIGFLYIVALERKQPVRTILPGIFSALISWLVLSIAFSFYVENFAHYSIVYGTLGAVMCLIIWLYMTALVLILGIELNAAIVKVIQDNKK